MVGEFAQLRKLQCIKDVAPLQQKIPLKPALAFPVADG
jgi:hypothetical protein